MVVLGWLGAGCARLWRRRSCSGEEGTPEGKWERGATRAGAGGDEGAPRRVVAWLGRAEATRGRRRGHAARGFCRWSATERVVQFISEPVQCLTTGFVADFPANPLLQSIRRLNKIYSPMYQLQLWLREYVQIRNQKQVMSSPRWACQAVNEPRLRKIA